MKRYVMFLMLPNNPNGGWGDLYAAYESLKEALADYRLVTYGMAQIVDLKTLKIVRSKLKREMRRDLN